MTVMRAVTSMAGVMVSADAAPCLSDLLLGDMAATTAGETEHHGGFGGAGLCCVTHGDSDL